MSELEPVPGDMPAVKRYYSDLKWKADSYVDLRIAAEKLLVDEHVVPEEASQDHLYGLVLPTAQQYAADRQAAMDAFTAFPLELVAPWVEWSQPIPSVGKWYESLAGYIKEGTEATHDSTCYDIDPDFRLDCRYGMVCPRRFLATQLQMEARTQDFDDLSYAVNPPQTRGVALEKLTVAKNTNIIAGDEYLALSSMYIFNFKKKFGTPPE